LTFAEELVHTTATLSEARRDLAATSVGNLALFAGGSGWSGYSDVVDVFNADTGSWSTATLSQARSCLAATTVGNLALFAGGQRGDSYGDVVDIYNADTGDWSTTTLSRPRARLAATSVGNLALFAGGWNQYGSSDVVDIYDAETGAWTSCTLSESVTLVATALDDKALFAGWNRSPEIRVDIYDAVSSTWSTASTSPGERLHGRTTVENRAIFAGTEYAHIFDHDANQWSAHPLSTSRYRTTATTLGTKALLAGGFIFNRELYHGDLDGDGIVGGFEHDIVRAHWGEEVMPSDGYHGDGSGDGFVGGDDLDLVRAWWGTGEFWEGSPRISFLDVVDIYDAATGLWSVDTLSVARSSMAATSVNGIAIFAGGRYYDKKSSNVVDLYSLPPDVQRVVPEPATVVLLVIGALVILGLHQRCKQSGVARTSGPSILHETVLHSASAGFHETCDLPKTAKARPCTQEDGHPAPSRQLVMQLNGLLRRNGV